MNRLMLKLLGIVASGILLWGCGSGPQDAPGSADQEETIGSSSEKLVDPCAAICQDTSDPYRSINCACCRRHLKNPTCYQ